MTERDDEPKLDGRRERTKRTRVAIVTALTELLDEGRIVQDGTFEYLRSVPGLFQRMVESDDF